MITVEELKAHLHYDPATGAWTWRVKRQGRRKTVGCISPVPRSPCGGHRSIAVNGRSYMSSRLAWLYMTGRWPAGEIDHRNGIGFDDRWQNLREATRPNAVRWLGFLGATFGKPKDGFITFSIRRA